MAVSGAALANPAPEQPSVKRAYNLAPPAQLQYQIRARLSGIRLDGDAQVDWHAGDGRYRISVVTRAPIAGRLLSAVSEGVIDEYGLAPQVSTEKRFRKSETRALFNRDTKSLTFSASSNSYPLRGGEQDRTSIVWQLVAHARAAPKKFTPGAEWRYFVAGQRDAEPWVFKVGKSERVMTGTGPMQAVRVTRLLPEDTKSQQLELWLAPSLEWYPARIRFAEGDGDFVEQTLSAVGGK